MSVESTGLFNNSVPTLIYLSAVFQVIGLIVSFYEQKILYVHRNCSQ